MVSVKVTAICFVVMLFSICMVGLTLNEPKSRLGDFFGVLWLISVLGTVGGAIWTGLAW